MRERRCLRQFGLMAAICLLAPPVVLADGAVVDRVYHPYVDPMTTELEMRSLFQDSQPGLVTPAQIHRVSLGTSIGQHLFAEIYGVGEKHRGGGFDFEAVEGELLWQLTEQGEYAADWGVLFEYEHELDYDAREAAVSLLTEKEFGRWSGTANLKLVYEWGNAIKDEFESVLALQWRYRHARGFEPGVEFYAGQNTLGAGPVVQGNIDAGVRRKLHWEAGVIVGFTRKSPDTSVRLLFEYEF